MAARGWAGVWVGLALFVPATGCDNGPAAVESGGRVDGSGTAEAAASAGGAPTPVTENRRESADAKVQRLYDRNGADFGATSADDYLAKVRAFAEKPPRGTETASRPNGDTLLYHPASNTFAVIARDGTPRTMFKPDDGPAYWAEQKSRAPTFGQRDAEP